MAELPQMVTIKTKQPFNFNSKHPLVKEGMSMKYSDYHEMLKKTKTNYSYIFSGMTRKSFSDIVALPLEKMTRDEVYEALKAKNFNTEYGHYISDVSNFVEFVGDEIRPRTLLYKKLNDRTAVVVQEGRYDPAPRLMPCSLEPPYIGDVTTTPDGTWSLYGAIDPVREGSFINIHFLYNERYIFGYETSMREVGSFFEGVLYQWSTGTLDRQFPPHFFCIYEDPLGRKLPGTISWYEGEMGMSTLITNQKNKSEEYTGNELFWKEWSDLREVDLTKGGFDIMKRFSPRVDTKAIEIVKGDKQKIKKILKRFWLLKPTESISYHFFGKPEDSLVALKFYYGLKDGLKLESKEYNLRLGRIDIDDINVSLSSSDFATRTFTIPGPQGKFNNFLDFSPYTSFNIFIPFVGFRELDVQDVLGANIDITYNVNLVTGVAVVLVYSKNVLRLMETTQMGVDIPLTVQRMDALVRDIATLASAGATMAALAAPAAVPALAVAGAAQAGAAATSAVMSSSNETRSSSLNSESGSLTEFRFITTTIRPKPFNLSILDTIGFPYMQMGVMGSQGTGLVTLDQILNTSSLNCGKFNGRVIEALRAGVYI